MANVRKKISELTALNSASLDTTLVGVDGGTTYKIELDTLADAVTSRVNILDRSRLASLESVTSSFETKGSGILSGSISYTSLTNIPQGIISQSTNLSSLNSFTQSIDGRVDSLENATSSYLISLNGAISASSQLTASYDERYVLSGSITQTTWDNIANKPNDIVSSSTQISNLGFISSSADITSLNQFTQSIDSRVDSLENSTGSYLTNLNGAISSSSQLTSSFDIRYTLSGSIAETTWNNISGKPSGIVSQSTDLTSLNQFTQSIDGRVDSLENATSSFETKGSGIISGAAQITSLGYSKLVGGNTFYNEQTFLNNVNIQGNLSSSVINSLNSFTQSFSTSVDSRFDTLEATIISGSINYTQVLGNRRTGITSVGTSIISGSITTTGNPVQIMVTGDANPTTTAWCRLQIFRDGNGIGNIIQAENNSNLNVPYCLNVIDTPPAGTYTYSMRTVDSMTGQFDFGEYNGPLLTAVELKSNTQLPSGLISGSSQLTSSYDTRYTLSGSVQPLPDGVVSGSSQLTSSYDTRYTLSGSVVSGTTPAGTISGSAQISAFGFVSGSYTTTSSFNSFTASAQTVTTGSNSFNGTQTITGSLIVTTGSFVGSQILANTSSLYLTSGSNMYVQNNGLVEITGSLVVSGSTNLIVNSLLVGTGSGDEGGEIQLAIPQTNTSLTNKVIIDVFQNKLRLWEGGANSKGVHIDLSKTPNDVAGELIWKTSGIVNAGTFVQLDNLKVTVTSSGNRGLSVGAVSTNFTANVSGMYGLNGGSGGSAANNVSYTTTASTSAFAWHFPTEGDGSTYTIVDKTNSRMYRVTLMIGSGYNNNFISIERLY